MSSNAPEDECSVPGFPPACPAEGVPLVLQVSLLDAESAKQDEFYYDPFTDLKFGTFAAARAFFIHHGPAVVSHEGPETMAFQEMFPMANIGYISALLPGLILITKGHEILVSQRDILCALARLPPSRPASPIHSGLLCGSEICKL